MGAIVRDHAGSVAPALARTKSVSDLSLKNALRVAALAAPLLCGCEETMVLGRGLGSHDSGASESTQKDCQTEMADGHKILVTVKGGDTYEMCGYASLSTEDETQVLIASISIDPKSFYVDIIYPKSPYTGTYEYPPQDDGVVITGSFTPGGTVQCSDGKTDYRTYSFGGGTIPITPFTITLQEFPSPGGYAIGVFSGTMKANMRTECPAQDSIDIVGSFNVLVK